VIRVPCRAPGFAIFRDTFQHVPPLPEILRLQRGPDVVHRDIHAVPRAVASEIGDVEADRDRAVAGGGDRQTRSPVAAKARCIGTLWGEPYIAL